MSLTVAELQLQTFQYAIDLRQLMELNDHLSVRQSALYRLCIQLNDTQSAFSRLYQNDTDIHFLTDIDGLVILCNQAAVSIAPKNSLSGSMLGAWVAEGDRKRFDELHHLVIQQAGKRVGNIDVVIPSLVHEKKSIPVSIHVYGVVSENEISALHWVMRVKDSSLHLRATSPTWQSTPQEKYDHPVVDAEILILQRRRANFEENVGQALESAKKTGDCFTIFLIAVDGLEEAGQRLGRQGKDLLIQNLSKRVCYFLRDTDIFTRISDDRFAILLKELSGDWNISQVCKKILLAFSQPIIIDNIEACIDGRIGCCEYPRHGNTKDTLINNSEAALLRIGENHDNNYEIFERVNLENGSD